MVLVLPLASVASLGKVKTDTVKITGHGERGPPFLRPFRAWRVGLVRPGIEVLQLPQ
jgi:hypothetical protein